MGFFDRFNMATKESELSQAIVSQYATGQAVWTPDDYASLAKKGYKVSPYVFACVDRLARGAAGVPLVLYKATGQREAKAIARKLSPLPPVERNIKTKALVASGQLEEVLDHPLLRLLDRPNDLYGGARLIEAAIAYRQIAGNVYLEAVGPDRRPPVELYIHRPDRMQVVVGTPSEPVKAYQYQAGGTTKQLPVENVLHWKTFHPLDDWYGMPPLLAAKCSMDQNNAAREWNVSLTQNSARPSGLLMIKGASQAPAATTPAKPNADGTVPKRNAVRALIDEIRNWQGSKNAGRPGILGMPQGVDISWTQTAFTPLEVSWMEGLGLSAREICVVLNVPSLLVGDVDAKTYANYAEARRALYQDGIFPLLDLFLSDLNNWLCPKFGEGLFLGYDTDAVDAVQEDRAKAHDRAGKGWERGLLNHAEARGAIGYGEDPEVGRKYIWQVMPKYKQPEGEDGKPKEGDS